MSKELKACPFCGSDHIEPLQNIYAIQCDTCKCRVIGGSRIDAINAWNTRAPAQMSDAELSDIADDFKSQYAFGGTTYDDFDFIAFARALLAQGK